MDRLTPTQYLALFAVILVAVAGGNLIANWVTAKAAQVEIEHVAVEASKVFRKEVSRMNAAQKQAVAKSNAARQAREQQVTRSRKSSPIGRTLAQQCDDWTRAYQEYQSQTARIEMDKNCQRYRTYVATGVRPPK